jgi:archaellum component FlaC
MNEQDFERIGQLIDTKLERIEAKFDARFEQIDARFEQIDARFEQIDARFEQIDARFELADAKAETFRNEIIAEFNQSLKLQTETLSHKIALLCDGILDVAERVEGVKRDFERLDGKVEDLSLHHLAHHLDPEAHSRHGGYRVKEEETVFGDGDPFHQFNPEFRRRLVAAGKSLDAAADEVRAYCAEKGIELPRASTEAMIRLIQESRKHRVEQELKKR